MAAAFIGIGSNLGLRRDNINKAILYLKNTSGVIVDKISSLLESVPYEASGSDYLNGVIKIETNLSAKDLLRKLQGIERRLGRIRTFKNASRIIDLDILLYDDKVIDEKDLKIPHPLMFKRPFVMEPLLEIAPDIKKLINNL